MLSSMSYRLLVSHTKSLLSGGMSPSTFGWFLVYGSGSYYRCSYLVGILQRRLGMSDKGLRLLDAQLEALKLLEEPECVNVI